MPDDAPLHALAGDPATSRLAIMLDPKDGGPIYQGIVALEAASVATLIEHYLTTSEQIESRLVLAADATRVRGLLLQRMPSAGPGGRRRVARRRRSRLDLGDAELLGAGERRGAARRALSRATTCACSRRAPRASTAPARASASANALRMLGRAEVESILAEQGMVGVTCEFCNRRYSFVAADARALFAPRGGGAGAPPDAARPSRK